MWGGCFGCLGILELGCCVLCVLGDGLLVTNNKTTKPQKPLENCLRREREGERVNGNKGRAVFRCSSFSCFVFYGWLSYSCRVFFRKKGMGGVVPQSYD